MKKKAVALLLAVVLVLGVAVGGTLAWLLDTTPEVKNTFTDSDISIELTEEEGKDAYQFKMIPDWTIAKDPMVTVEAGSEDCYVFVKVDKSANYGTYLKDYAVAKEWTKLEDGDTTDAVGVDGVYYQKVTGLTEENAKAWSDYVLKGADHKDGCAMDDTCECPNLNGYVTVQKTVTKEDMNALTAQTYPTLTFTAYASQLMRNNTTEFTAYEAWVNVYANPANPANP